MYRYRIILHEKRWWLRGGIFLAALMIGLYGLHVNFGPRPVATFEECLKAGHKLIEGDPQTCTDGKRTFAAAEQTAPEPAPQPAAPEDVITMAQQQMLVDGDARGQYPARRQVIRTPAAWQAFWNEVHAAITPRPALLPVDFSKHSVIALTAGPSLKAGRHLSVTSVEIGKSGSTVYLRELVPAANCPTGKAVSNPYTLVQTEKLSEPVKYEVMTRERKCASPPAPAPVP